MHQHAVPVRTVDPSDQNVRDLRALKKVIGDTGIVMFGEISHGDGTSMLATSRLVKFLHQQMNFDVLVFESGFYDMSKVWESIRQGQEPVAAVQRGVYPVWSRSPQVRDLFDYIGTSAKSSRPLALASFDLPPSLISPESLLRLGHVSIQMIERSLECKQKLRCAVNDTLGIEPECVV